MGRLRTTHTDTKKKSASALFLFNSKFRISKIINKVPDKILEDVLDFVKELQEQPSNKIKLANNLRQILSEDKELLEKLAK